MAHRTLFATLLTAALLLTAAPADPWAKVHELKTGQELRIIRSDSKQPMLANMDELTEESLIVVVKDRQVSIPKASIQRIDARPISTKSRLVRENKTTTSYPDKITTPPTQMNNGGAGQSVSSSSSLSIGPKPDFEMVYRKGLSASPEARREDSSAQK